MRFVLIIGLITAVVTLVWVIADQKRAITKYEDSLIKKSKKRKK